MNTSKIIEELYTDLGVINNAVKSFNEKMTALHKAMELDKSGTESNSSSNEEYIKKRDKVLYKRKKALIRAGQKLNNK